MGSTATNLREGPLPERGRKLPPFITMVPDTCSMYDHLPYSKDVQLCTRETIKLVTGNIIKYYTCAILPPVIIDDNEIASVRLAELKNAIQRRRISERTPAAEAEPQMPEPEIIMEAKAAPAVLPAPELPSKKVAARSAGKLTNAFADIPDDTEEDFSFLK